MLISLYSVIMAVIASSLMILLIYIFTKNRRLDKHFGLTSVVALYICSIFRMLIPIEFHKFNFVLGDPVIMKFIVDYAYRPVFNPTNTYQGYGFLFMHLLAIVLGAVAVILIARQTIKYRRFLKKISLYPNLATIREKKIFDEVLSEFNFRKRFNLIVIDENISPITYGYFSPNVLLPCNNFSDEELKLVFKHELTHQKNHDTLLKLLIEIYCCLFWWNPFVYLLKSNLDQKLEIKCDSAATKGCSEDEKLSYLTAILKCIRSCKIGNKKAKKKTRIGCALVSMEFAADADSAHTKERFDYVLDTPPKKHMGKILNILMTIVCVLILAASYIFVWQPIDGDGPPEETVMENGVELVDEANSYVLKKKDGTYVLCIEGCDPLPISAEEVEEGMYQYFDYKEE